MQHAVPDAVAADVFAVELVAVQRQRKLPRHAVPVEDQGVFRQSRHRAGVGEIAFEEILDTPVGRAQVAGQQARLLAIAVEQVAGNREKIAASAARARRLPRRGQLEVDVQLQALAGFARVAQIVVQSEKLIQVHHPRHAKGGILTRKPREPGFSAKGRRNADPPGFTGAGHATATRSPRRRRTALRRCRFAACGERPSPTARAIRRYSSRRAASPPAGPHSR